MAGKIKGITIEIGGDTQKLSKAIKQINKDSKDMQSELKKVEKLLKLDPTNADLLAQKQEILNGAIEKTEERLGALKVAGAKAQEQLAKGEITKEQFRELQREIIRAEQDLTGLKSSVSSLNAIEEGADQATTAIVGLGDEADQTVSRLDKIKSGLSGIGDKLKSIGGKLTATVTAPLTAAFGLAVEGTREFRGDMAKLETNIEVAGGSVEKTTKALEYLEVVTGETDSNIEALSNLLEAGFTDNQLLEAVDALSGAVIKFPDTLKIEGLADGLEETLATGKGVGPFAEMIERLGYNLDDFDEGLAKASESGEKTQYILDFLAKTGLSDVNQKFKENNETLIEGAKARLELQQQLASIGDMLEPIMTTITTIIADMLAKFNELDTGTQKVILIIVGLIAAIGPLLIMFGLVAGGISSIIAIMPAIMTGLGALGGAFAFITSPIGLVIVAITALIAIFAYLWTTNEEFKNNFIALWMSIKDFIVTTLTDIKEYFSAVFDAIQLLLSAFIKLSKGDFKGFLNDMVLLVTQAIPRMLQAGRDLFNNLWDGMKEVWLSLSTWVSETCDWLLDKLMFWRNSKSEMESDGADGSHSQGLSYVPFNGYRAILHEGEAVLTKAENKAYQDDKQTTGSINVTQNFYDKQDNPAAQQRRAVREMKKLSLVVQPS